MWKRVPIEHIVSDLEQGPYRNPPPPTTTTTNSLSQVCNRVPTPTEQLVSDLEPGYDPDWTPYISVLEQGPYPTEYPVRGRLSP